MQNESAWWVPFVFAGVWYETDTDSRTQHPPGNEIYRNGNVAVFEIDGSVAKRYARVGARLIPAHPWSESRSCCWLRVAFTRL